MEGISRMDSRSTHGWFVRVYRDGLTHSKLFSDGVYGSEKDALKEALRYKACYEKRHPRQPAATRYRQRLQRNNTTGITGISETFHRDRKGNKLPCFSITWSPQPNVRRNKRIYHHHHTDRQEAFEAATLFRKEREAEIEQSAWSEQSKKLSNGGRRERPSSTSLPSTMIDTKLHDSELGNMEHTAISS